MLKTLDVPTSNISKLKESPTQLFKEAAKAESGIYIFNRNTPSGVVMSVHDYEKMVKEINELQEQLFDAEAAARLKHDSKVYSDKEVRGDEAASGDVYLDDNDGWE